MLSTTSPAGAEGPLRMPAQPSFIEPLAWFDAHTSKPLVGQQVLLWIRHRSDGTETWEAGWFDRAGGNDTWLLCESGGLVDGEVLFYADPVGHRACPSAA